MLFAGPLPTRILAPRSNHLHSAMPIRPLFTFARRRLDQFLPVDHTAAPVIHQPSHAQTIVTLLGLGSRSVVRSQSVCTGRHSKNTWTLNAAFRRPRLLQQLREQAPSMAVALGRPPFASAVLRSSGRDLGDSGSRTACRSILESPKKRARQVPAHARSAGLLARCKSVICTCVRDQGE